MTSNEQESSSYQSGFDGFENFTDFFKSTFSSADQQAHQERSMQYEEFMKEYEQFFNLEDDEQDVTNSQRSSWKFRQEELVFDKNRLRGLNVIIDISLSLHEITAKQTKELTYNLSSLCRSCKGEKVIKVAETSACVHC
mmetsp:Transcript_17837/g.30262  ORF Transcript_17837/g.30262 Transcript_17837/m.30262 type:complete len:139 (+) Transcript_17837:443-859(+)